MGTAHNRSVLALRTEPALRGGIWRIPGHLRVAYEVVGWRPWNIPLLRRIEPIESSAEHVLSVLLQRGLTGNVTVTYDDGRRLGIETRVRVVRELLRDAGFDLRSRPSWPGLEIAVRRGTEIDWSPPLPRAAQ